eukprot:6065680-Prymnesium_polylepis.1
MLSQANAPTCANEACPAHRQSAHAMPRMCMCMCMCMCQLVGWWWGPCEAYAPSVSLKPRWNRHVEDAGNHGDTLGKHIEVGTCSDGVPMATRTQKATSSTYLVEAHEKFQLAPHASLAPEAPKSVQPSEEGLSELWETICPNCRSTVTASSKSDEGESAKHCG